MNSLIKNEKGAILLELFIAIALLTILLNTSLSLIFPSVRSAEIGRQRLQAKWLLWEEEEAVRQVRNEAWSDLVPGSYYPQYNQTANPPTQYQGWQLEVGNGVVNGFTENIVITVPDRVSSNQLSDNTGTADSSMRKVVCTVSWTSFGTPYSETLTTYLSDWQPF